MSFRGSIDDERGGLLAELTAGFEALMEKADELVSTNDRLTERLRALQVEFRSQNTPNQASSASSAADLDEEPSSPPPPPPPSEWRQDATINTGIQAWKLLKIATVSAVPLLNNMRIGSHSERLEKLSEKVVPLLQPPNTLEKDFTTEGPKGDLKCPFSKRGAVLCGNPHRLPDPNPYMSTRRSVGKPALSPDPIAREFQSSVKDESVPADTVTPKCPIRFIDQHTPEEVAKYVEKHKHEIPRSHEVCVRRYQANEASIRSLDAKYGSLVKMIQGLSEKHKSMLPTDAEADGAPAEPVLDGKSMEKVEKWAKELPDGDVPAPGLDIQSRHGSEERTGHFERPLEEVRLGESPSRPWGIRVPYDAVPEHHSQAAHGERRSGPSSVAHPVNAPIHENDAPRANGKCPFGHGTPQFAAPDASNPDAARNREPLHPNKQFLDEALGSDKDSKTASRVIFTGPVFFGYSAEEAAALMGVVPGMVNRGSQH